MRAQAFDEPCPLASGPEAIGNPLERPGCAWNLWDGDVEEQDICAVKEA